MISNIEILEDRIIDCNIEKLKKLTDIDITSALKGSSDIDKFEEYKPDTFKLITKEKKVALKKLQINANLVYKQNKDIGILHVYSDPDVGLKEDETNINIDLKVRLVEISEDKTLLAFKINCDFDFGLSKIINKSINSFIKKEIIKIIEKQIKKNI